MGKKIRAYMKSRGWSNADLARASRIQKSHVGWLVKDGSNPTVSTLKKLAAAFGVPAASLLVD